MLGEGQSARDLEQHQYLKGGQRNPGKGRGIYRGRDISKRGCKDVQEGVPDCPVVRACRTPGLGGPSTVKDTVTLVRAD